MNIVYLHKCKRCGITFDNQGFRGSSTKAVFEILKSVRVENGGSDIDRFSIHLCEDEDGRHEWGLSELVGISVTE